MKKTIANCRVIRTGKWIGAGVPNNDGIEKCEGYCTLASDEPCEKCKRCKYLKNWEAAGNG